MEQIDALVCEAPGRLVLDRRPAPARGEGEVLVRPRRVGICGTDYHIYEGKHPFLKYPRVMGHELGVEVVDAPAGSGWRTGDICTVNPYIACGTCIACRNGKPNCCVQVSVLGVHRDGGMAGLLSLPLRQLVRAEGLGIDACATVEFLAIGAHAVRRGAITSADRVLVIGAGPIGVGVALFACSTGATVAVMDLDASRLAAIASLAGATTIAAGETATDTVASLTAGEGFDVVLDATGNTRSIERGFDFVAHGGRYVLVSVVKGPIHFEDADFHRREMTLLGSRNATAVDFEHVIEAIRQGRVDPDRLITHRSTLVAAVHDIPAWAVDKAGLTKALIEIY